MSLFSTWEGFDGSKRDVLLARPWELFGFGCHYAWLLSIAFGTTIYAGFESPELVASLRLAVFAGIALMYSVLFFAQRFTAQFTFHKPVVVGAGALGSVGTFLLIVPFSGAASLIVWAVGCLAIGFSNALSMTAGNRLWANNRPEYGMLQLTVSTVLAVLVYYLLLLILLPIAVVIIAMLPFVGDVILARTKGGRQRVPTYRRMDSSARGVDKRLLAYAFAFALVTGCMLGGSAIADASAMHYISIITMLGVLATSIFTLFAALRKKLAAFLKDIDKPVSAVFVIGLGGLLLMVATGGSLYREVPWPQALIMAAYVLVDQFLWLVNPDLVFRSQKPSATILARSCAFEWSGLALGFFVGYAALGGWGMDAPINYATVVFLGLSLFAVMRTFVFSHTDAIMLAEARSSAVGEETLLEHCQVLAEQYALSSREREVFLLLARGRSGPFIQEELMLAQSTVKTHTRNIYRKFNVGTKQELLDLVNRDL